ncbi:hypothetical protein BMETH_1870_0 [methanotrophic bacterial endosymbiont of Bathymodiolus sp.]|nr:hypothetical protein BMETH_1870_0 [methanotrophic bacterial endosymbiont of Bathymodiolus sp.]
MARACSALAYTRCASTTSRKLTKPNWYRASACSKLRLLDTTALPSAVWRDAEESIAVKEFSTSWVTTLSTCSYSANAPSARATAAFNRASRAPPSYTT